MPPRQPSRSSKLGKTLVPTLLAALLVVGVVGGLGLSGMDGRGMASPTKIALATPVPVFTEAIAKATATPVAEFAPTSPPGPAAEFIRDVTIPDGTPMKPGQEFVKTWRFQNIGNVPWGEGVRWVFVEGVHDEFESQRMSGPDSVDVHDVKPGELVDVSVDLVAPHQLGRYRSYWRLQLENGEWLEEIHYVEIVVTTSGP
jgi:hypothetical protein